MGTDDLAKSFGLVLKELRQAKSLTQEGLADLAGFDRTYVGFLERGTRSPSLETVYALSKALDISAGRMIARVDAVRRST
jgi:transcriptional regulator with XRE-family HTH domain